MAYGMNKYHKQTMQFKVDETPHTILFVVEHVDYSSRFSINIGDFESEFTKVRFDYKSSEEFIDSFKSGKASKFEYSNGCNEGEGDAYIQFTYEPTTSVLSVSSVWGSNTDVKLASPETGDKFCKAFRDWCDIIKQRLIYGNEKSENKAKQRLLLSWQDKSSRTTGLAFGTFSVDFLRDKKFDKYDIMSMASYYFKYNTDNKSDLLDFYKVNIVDRF
jgi:hypothetical protein